MLGDLLARPRAGTVVLATAALTALFLLVVAVGLGRGWDGAWKLLWVRPAPPPFADMHAITDNAACAARGVDVYHDASCDVPQHRMFNYPPPVLWVGRLGIDGGDTAWLAGGIEILALLALAALFKGRSVRQGLIASLALLSPSVTLAFERGNIDLLEFALVAGAALLFSERHGARRAGAVGLLGAAVAVKLYPLFSLALVARFTRRAAVAAGALAALSAAYILAILPWLKLIRANTPQAYQISYGYRVPFLAIQNKLGPRFGWDVAGLVDSGLPALAAAVAIGLAAAGGVLAWRRNALPGGVGDGVAGTAFLFGAGIYCGTFLLGSNYQYRLVFLLLCLPQLLDWMGGTGAAAAPLRTLGRRLLWVCLVVLFLTRKSGEVLYLDQVIHWGLFVTLGGLLLANALRTMAPGRPAGAP